RLSLWQLKNEGKGLVQLINRKVFDEFVIGSIGGSGMADVTRLHKFVRKADGLQDFQRAGLNASGTAFMGRPVVLIDNPARDAMPIQLSRHEQARWTCAHHQYLGVTGHQVS